MRFLILLIFGGMGAALLYLGWTRYQTAANQLKTWPQATGVVVRAAEDGYVVQYDAGEGPHQVSADRWVGWPAVKDGDKLQVVYDPQSPDSGRVNAWYEIYKETAVILFFASIGLFLGIGGFFALRSSMGAMAEITEHAAVAMEESRPSSFSLGEAVELRHPASSAWMMVIGAVLAFVVSGVLFRAPDILYSKFLSWPVAILAIVLGIMVLLAAYDQKHTVLRADLNGLREESRWSKKEAAWTQVAKIVRLRRTLREYSQTTKRYSTRTVGYTWVLSDREGAELIKIDEDMEPREAVNRLLRYIPSRTGLTVEERTE